MSAKRCLLEAESYRYGSTRLRDGRIVPYVVHFPKSVSNSVREALAARTKEVLPWNDWKTVRIFGIAHSGIPLARAVKIGLRQVTASVHMNILDPRVGNPRIAAAAEGIQAIIVDNAVTTGASLLWAVRILKRSGYQPTIAVRFFDREEIEPDGCSQPERLRREIAINLLSLFRVRDLLQIVTDAERQELLDHLVLHGTVSVRQHMEDAYVFQDGTWSPR